MGCGTSSYWSTGNGCCNTPSCGTASAQDLLNALCSIISLETSIRDQLITLSSNLFNPATYVFTQDAQLYNLINGFNLPTTSAGTWDSVDVDDTGTTLATTTWQKIRVINPTTNANNATVDVGGNVRTLVPNTTDGIGILDIEFPYFVTTPAVTVTAGAGETVILEVTNF